MGGEELLRKESRKERRKGGTESLFFQEGSLREISPRAGRGGLVLFFEICLPFCHFSHLFTEQRRKEVTSRNDSCGKSVCWRGKEDFGRGINKYVNIFPVEKDSSKKDSFWIEDQRGATSINCFEARILRDEIFPFSFSTTPWRKSSDSRIIKSGMHPFLSSISSWKYRAGRNRLSSNEFPPLSVFAHIRDGEGQL